MNPTQQVKKQKDEYWKARTAKDLADPNRGSDPRERTDIKLKLDSNLGDVPTPFYSPTCCYSVTSSTPGDPPFPPVLTVISGSAILNWTSDRGIIDNFQTQKSLNGNSFSDLANVGGNVFTYTDTNVSSSISGSTYWYKVAGYNVYGTSSWSNIVSITFTSSIPPIPPIPSGCKQTVFSPQLFTGSLTSLCQGVTPNVSDMIWTTTLVGNATGSMSGGFGTFKLSSSYGVGSPTSSITFTSKICFPTSYLAETDARFSFYNDPAGNPNNYYIIQVTYNTSSYAVPPFTQYPAWPTGSGYVTPLGGLITLPQGINTVTCSVYLNSGSAESDITGSLTFFKFP